MAVNSGIQSQLKSGEPVMTDYTPSGAAVVPGQVVVVGDVPMIAHSAIADGVLGALATAGGIYYMQGDAAIGAGKYVFWDDTNKKFTLTTTNKGLGFTVEACAADAAVTAVKHNPTFKLLPT